jgi:hypothetical protein
MTDQYIVTLQTPEDVTRAQMRQYIKDAVCGWKGHLNPIEDPLFVLDIDTVTVQTVKE